MSTTLEPFRVLVSRTRPLPEGHDPLTAWDRDGFAFLHEHSGLATSGVAAHIPVGTGPGRITRAADRVAAVLAGVAADNPIGVPGTGPLAVGAIPFSDDTPGELVVPAVVVGSNSRGQAWITETGPSLSAGGPERPLRAGSRGPSVTDLAAVEPIGEQAALLVDGDRRQDWMATVGEALGLILAGTMTKVVLARQLEVRSERAFDTRSILARLREKHRSCWTYAAGGYVGSSPELLVRRRRDWVESTPMAGTVPQGGGGATDERLVTQLASSVKDLAEHSLVVDEVLAALEPVCREVFAHAEPQIVRLSTVAHLATTVAGWLRHPPLSALALAGLLHPTPAVGGIPQDAALAAISRMEDFDRGLYAGPLGWVDARGDGDWVVALRGAQLDGNRATVTAGAGIVADSNADAEWRETEAKLAAMLGILGG